MGSQARVTQYQSPVFIRGTVAYNTNGIANGVVIGHIPAGARITVVHYWVEVAQNAGTTNTLSVGLIPETQGQLTAAPAAQSQLVSAVATGTATQSNAAPTGTNGVISQDQAVVVSLAQSGTAASAGVVTVAVQYVPNL